MSRKDFINDHLVDMRAQLRDSYAAYHQKKAVQNDVPETETPFPENDSAQEIVPDDSAVVKTESPVKKQLTLLTSGTDSSVLEREWRELEGRVAHDLAELDSEKMLLTQKMQELERFAVILEKTRNELYSGDLNKIRLDYFSARGRWSSFENKAVPASNLPIASGEERNTYWIAGAIIGASVIMALTLLGLFA